MNGRPRLPAHCISQIQKIRNYATAADNTSSPRWVPLEPELEDALVPRKLSVSPLESWLSLRYSLPTLLESIQPQEDIGQLEEKVLPPTSAPVMEDEEGSTTPIQCKNDLEIRRRKMNRHKYKKLRKRTKFLRKRVLERRGRKKQVCIFLCQNTYGSVIISYSQRYKWEYYLYNTDYFHYTYIRYAYRPDVWIVSKLSITKML